MSKIKDLQVELQDVNGALMQLQRQMKTIMDKQQLLQKQKQRIEREIAVQQATCDLGLDPTKENWGNEDFPWSSELRTKLTSIFALNAFRPKQLEVINATLSNRDTILIMPTGGGKSLCYQLPALISKGVTLVISPLISLMKDQVYHLTKHGIAATTLNSESGKTIINQVQKELSNVNTDLKLVYITPERLAKSKRFKSNLEKCYKAGNLARIAIDEVHCVSKWGNDFRTDYKILSILKRQFPKTPIIGLTATSTQKVTDDTKEMLDIPSALVFKTPLNRPNLFYEVRNKPASAKDAIDDITATIRKHFENECGIVYCLSCKNTEQVAEFLQQNGIKAAPYHANLSSDMRTKVQNQWNENKIKVICATVAFGMGINKPDVRFVIHHSMSKSVENYYQESGRAGRDGQPALCLLYFGFADIFRHSAMVVTERTGLRNLQDVTDYCTDFQTCRRRALSRHFEERWEVIECEGMCDNCAAGERSQLSDVTMACRALLEMVEDAEARSAGAASGERLTGAKLVSGAGKGRFKANSKFFKSLDTKQIQLLVILMLKREFLREDFHFTPYSTISYLVPGRSSSLLAVETVKAILPTEQSPQNRCALLRNAMRPKIVAPLSPLGGETNSKCFPSGSKKRKGSSKITREKVARVEADRNSGDVVVLD